MGRDFRKLELWDKAYSVVLSVYSLLSDLPSFEQNNLGDQARRAATSIVLNIAEGAASRSNKVFLQHLNFAYASAKELDVVLFLLRDLYSFDVSLVLSSLDVVKKMLFGLMKSVEQQVRFGADNFSFDFFSK